MTSSTIMYVYSIKNKQTHKRYIGATTRGIQRITEHLSNLRRNIHQNSHLQNAWNKSGEENFVINMVAEVSTLNELDKLEEKLISKYGDYNIRTGGSKCFKMSEESKKKISRAAMGRASPTKGMTFNRPTKIRDESAQRQKPDGYPILISPDGEEVSFINLKRFSKEQKLWFSGVRQLVEGTIDCYKGWTRKGTNYISRGHTISNRRRPQGFPDVISPSGDTYSIEILSEFCRIHNLSKGNMSQLINGKKESYKGWTLNMEI